MTGKPEGISSGYFFSDILLAKQPDCVIIGIDDNLI